MYFLYPPPKLVKQKKKKKIKMAIIIRHEGGIESGLI